MCIRDRVDGIHNHTFEQVKPGDIRYEDTNQDGKVDTYDYQPIGRPSVPEIVYGFGFKMCIRDSPNPSPLLAPFTSPAISTISTVVGTIRW